MARIIDITKRADGLERTDSVETISTGYKHLHNCDPYQDLLFAEIDGEPIGYCGFAMLRLDGSELLVEYFDETSKKLLEERWRLGAAGPIGSVALGDQLKAYRPLGALVS